MVFGSSVMRKQYCNSNSCTEQHRPNNIPTAGTFSITFRTNQFQFLWCNMRAMKWLVACVGADRSCFSVRLNKGLINAVGLLLDLVGFRRSSKLSYTGQSIRIASDQETRMKDASEKPPKALRFLDLT